MSVALTLLKVSLCLALEVSERGSTAICLPFQYTLVRRSLRDSNSFPKMSSGGGRSGGSAERDGRDRM